MNLLNFIGMASVMATKDTNTNQIIAYVPALFPTADGRAVATAQTVARTSLNARGESVTSTNLHTNGVPADWMNTEGASRLTSPDVREGSQVAIYQVSGQNKYYWTTQGVNSDTFRLETVMHGWSANPNLDENTPFSVDNYYLFTIDTRTGFMSLRTAQSNGEKSAFEIKIDGGAGIVSVAGSEGSFFVVNDPEHSLTYQNADETVLNVNKQIISAFTHDTINLFAEKQMNIKTKELNIQAETANIDIGLTKWKGRLERTGDDAQVGDYDLTGNVTHEGNTTQEGAQTTTGLIHSDTDVTATAISLIGHGHGEVESGDGVSGPPLPG